MPGVDIKAEWSCLLRQERRFGSKSAPITCIARYLNLQFAHSQVKFLRESAGSNLNIFAPINDLSSLSKSSSEDRALVPGKKNNVAITGGQIFGDEYSDYVLKVNMVISCCFWKVFMTFSA
jgi:hypothetical protein